SFNRTDLGMSTTTGTTLFPPGTGKIAAAIANHSSPISSKPGPDQFALFAIRQGFACFRINTLNQKSIGPGMHTITNLALTGHARTKKFGHTELVIGSNIEIFLKLQA